VLVGEGSSLAIVAADWPELPVRGGAPGEVGRQTGRIAPTGVRPVLLGDLEVRGTAPTGSAAPGELILDGLLISGQLTVNATTKDLGTLTLAHCSVRGGLRTTGTNEQLAVRVQRSQLGAIRLGTSIPSLTVADSVLVTPDNGAALDARGAATELDGVTVM